MKLEDFCVVHKSKAGIDKVLCYEIKDIEILKNYFSIHNNKPSMLASTLGIHYQSMRKILQDTDLWKYVKTKNGKGAGINRSRMNVTTRDGYPYSDNPNSYDIKDGRSRRKIKHIEVMENHLKRKLHSDEVVHHIDGNKMNFSIDNLALLTRSEHGLAHKSLEALAMSLVSSGFIKYNSEKKIYEFSKDSRL